MARKLPLGDNMIDVNIKFWTDMPYLQDKDLKTAGMIGVIYLPKNKSRGIDIGNIHFKDEKHFLSKLKELLDKNGIKLLNHKDPQHAPVDLTKI